MKEKQIFVRAIFRADNALHAIRLAQGHQSDGAIAAEVSDGTGGVFLSDRQIRAIDVQSS
jgi:hypothetical protein